MAFLKLHIISEYLFYSNFQTFVWYEKAPKIKQSSCGFGGWKIENAALKGVFLRNVDEGIS